MIGIVSHDAGGAEILSSWIKHNSNLFFIYSLSGPAIKIFKNKIGKIKNLKIASLIKKSDKIITGTSFPAEHELNAIKMAKKKEIHSISYLDHWINYKERFLRKKILTLPNEIWVGDKLAYQLAQKKFKKNKTKIKIVKNMFFFDVKKQSKKIKSKKQLLYVTTPIADFAKDNYGDRCFYGFTEESALLYFLNNIDKIKSRFNIIKIRPHPSENKSKYIKFKKYDKRIIIDKSKNILDDILISRVVVGYNSMAMILASIVGKKVISCLPKGKLKNILPIKKMIHI